MKRRIKRVLKWVGLLVLIFLVWNGEMVWYGLGQGWGQAQILMDARPIEEVLEDPQFPDSLKHKIRLVQEIRQFAVDSLGLTDSDNYTTLYDQKGQPVLWVVNACQPYSLEGYKWDYPLLGSLGYKGFFVREKADKEAAIWAEKGLDTDVGQVTAWSTLGWFRDPILSEMLNRSDGMLARLIIHELTHATLYVPGEGDYNENLATFVGDQGAFLFLEQKYGKDSEAYRSYAGRLSDIDRYSRHVLGGAALLDSLYTTMEPQWPDSVKNWQKQTMIRNIMRSADTIDFYHKARYEKVLNPDDLPNNTFFMQRKMYRSAQDTFRLEFEGAFNQNFKAYIRHLKSIYPSV